jgi:hypothetical protein
MLGVIEFFAPRSYGGDSSGAAAASEQAALGMVKRVIPRVLYARVF